MVSQIRTSWNTLVPYMEEIASAMQQKVELAKNNKITARALINAVGK
jgi:hypothetical protein